MWDMTEILACLRGFGATTNHLVGRIHTETVKRISWLAILCLPFSLTAPPDFGLNTTARPGL
jgi:hypothetical protein